MKLLLLLCFIAFGAACTAQPAALYFEKINVQQGLSHNKVNCIIQDKRGFIWLGTDDGLNRFDGKKFIHFRYRPQDSTSISGNIITDLLEDRQGRIWIATADGGLSRYDYRLPPAQQFRQYRHHPSNKNSIPVNGVNTIIEDQQGFIWLGTIGHDVLRFDKNNEAFTKINQGKKTILDLAMTPQGTIYVGRHGGGLMSIDPATTAVKEDARYADFYAKLPHVTITALYSDGASDLWFGSWDRVLYRKKLTDTAAFTYRSGTSAFIDDEVLSFGKDQWGRLWIGGKDNGLQILDIATGKFQHYRFDAAREGSISDNRINCIFTDRQGRTWLGTNKGVSINNPEKQQFTQYFLEAPGQSPITIYDFHQRANGDLWIGTSAGLYIKDLSGRVSHRRLQYRGKHLHITSFLELADGSCYLGTDYSLFRYDPQSQQLALLPGTEKDGVMNQVVDSRIVGIVQDSIEGQPALIVLPYGHFFAYYQWAQGRWTSRRDSSNILKRYNLQDNLIRKIVKTKDGSLWMATGKAGLAWWQRGARQMVYYSHDPADPYSLASDDVYDLAEDEKGNLWVSTYGGGLHYFNLRTKKFTRISATDNLVEGIRLDHHGNVWMISNGKLHKFDPRRKTYSSYNLPDLQRSGGVKGKIFRDAKGVLFLAGQDYFISFHPDSIRATRTMPQVFLTDFQVFNKSLSHLLEQEAIRLEYKDNYFSLEFAAPHYETGTVYYSYKLEGFDEDWIDAGERNYVSYPNLEGGDYVFRVRAGTTPGVWGAPHASIRISIIPPFWKRAWFYVLCAALLALATYLIYRYRINELLKRQAIRNRIAQDLHDNVGSTLSSISVYSQVAKIYHRQQKEEALNSTLEKISATSSEMISELNDTVWAINPRNDNMEVILRRMESFAKPLLASKEIKFVLQFENGIRFLNLEMEKRKNLYLIFKEAVNNILKYADCKNVQVTLTQHAFRLRMTISDDGKGFDMARTSEGYKSSDVYGGGNGLRNMQLRAREMQGELKISSSLDNGTMVILDFPIT